jgi:hypothetical protein
MNQVFNVNKTVLIVLGLVVGLIVGGGGVYALDLSQTSVLSSQINTLQTQLTISKGTARRVMELARAKDLPVDQLINELMTVTEEHGWPTCSLF